MNRGLVIAMRATVIKIKKTVVETGFRENVGSKASPWECFFFRRSQTTIYLGRDIGLIPDVLDPSNLCFLPVAKTDFRQTTLSGG